MYVAIFELYGGYRMQSLCKGENANELFDAFNKVQSLDCLVSMGSSRERAKGKKELAKLESIIAKRYANNLTIEDLAGLDVTLSIGSIKCLEIAEGDNAEAELRAKYPRAE